MAFHVFLRSGQEVHPNETLEHDEYLSNTDMMLRSARLFNCKITATVLTDLHTDLTDISFPFRRVGNPLDPARLMLERTMAQLRYVQAHDFSAPLVLLDTDILINGPLTQLIERPFDVALTWRDNAEMPINGGFLILNNLRPKVSKAFFARFASLYQEKYADKASWFGDQLALRDCIGLSYEQMVDNEVVEIDGCRVLLLPCDTYNFSPDNQYQAIGSPLPDKLVLHFKGPRKRLMSPFWEAWLHDRQRLMPWAKKKGPKMRDWLEQQTALESSESAATGERTT